MHHGDVLVACLASLCTLKGGAEKVAAKAGVSAENIKQILRGTKLPSGNPRGVGPQLRKKLDETFPGWRDGAKAYGAGSPTVLTAEERVAAPGAFARSMLATEHRNYLWELSRSLTGASALVVSTISNALTQVVRCAADGDMPGVDEGIELLILTLQAKQREADFVPPKSIGSNQR